MNQKIIENNKNNIWYGYNLNHTQISHSLESDEDNNEWVIITRNSENINATCDNIDIVSCDQINYAKNIINNAYKHTNSINFINNNAQNLEPGHDIGLNKHLFNKNSNYSNKKLKLINKHKKNNDIILNKVISYMKNKDNVEVLNSNTDQNSYSLSNMFEKKKKKKKTIMNKVKHKKRLQRIRKIQRLGNGKKPRNGINKVVCGRNNKCVFNIIDCIDSMNSNYNTSPVNLINSVVSTNVNSTEKNVTKKISEIPCNILEKKPQFEKKNIENN